jgi:hypothetical protein
VRAIENIEEGTVRYTYALCAPMALSETDWGNWGFFCPAPQDFVVLGVFCARFPPREAVFYFRPAAGGGGGRNMDLSAQISEASIRSQQIVTGRYPACLWCLLQRRRSRQNNASHPVQ